MWQHDKHVSFYLHELEEGAKLISGAGTWHHGYHWTESGEGVWWGEIWGAENILLVGVGLYGGCRIRLHVKSHKKKKE